MLVFALLLSSASFTAGQLPQCECFADATRGFWETNATVFLAGGAECTQCLSDFRGESCSLAIRQCDPAITCLGLGSCNSADGTCTCFSGFEGARCETCSNSEFLHPYCDGTPVCKPEVDCNGNGACPVLQSCGGGAPCNAAVDKCCQYESVLGDSVSFCASKYHECCGPSSCAVGEKCVDRNIGLCLPTTRELCTPMLTDGSIDYTRMGYDPLTFAPIGAPSFDQCTDKKSCCDGTCCEKGSSCEEQQPPAQGWPAEQEYTPMYCEPRSLTAPSVVRAIISPAMLTIVSVIGLAALLVKTQFHPIDIKIVGVLTIFMSCIVLFSHFWPYAIVAIMTSFFAMGAPSGSSKHKWVYSLVVQFLTLTVYCGGFGLGTIFTGIAGGNLQFPAQGYNANYQGGWRSIDAQVSACNAHYAYFLGPSPPGQKWDSVPGWSSQSICGRQFITGVMAIQTLVLSFLVLMIVRTGINAVKRE